MDPKTKKIIHSLEKLLEVTSEKTNSESKDFTNLSNFSNFSIKVIIFKEKLK